MKNVIITGANGFIGSTLTACLAKRGIQVTAIYREDYSNIPISPFVKKVKCSLNSVDEMMQTITSGEYDAMYHFAWEGVNGSAKADPVIQLNNTKMTINCAAVANKLGVKKLLCAGTIAERNVECLSELEKTGGGMLYGIIKHTTHLILETYCKCIGQPFIWMQFSNIYGPLNKTGNLISYTISTITNGEEATFGPAEQPYDFIYIDDLIEAVVQLGEKNTRENFYYIGSGQPRILKEYLYEIGKQAKHEDLIRIGIRPDDGIKYSMDMFDTSALNRDIGDYANTSFSDGIARTLKFESHE